VLKLKQVLNVEYSEWIDERSGFRPALPRFSTAGIGWRDIHVQKQAEATSILEEQPHGA